MSNSSANALVFEDWLQFALPRSSGTSNRVITPSGFGSAADALAARQAGRLNASAISEREHERLLSERSALLDKKFEGTISRQEENRLAYIRWSLDRIEDAKFGSGLDELESIVSQYERFRAEIERLKNQIESMSGSRGRR